MVTVNNLPIVVGNLPPATEVIIEQCRQEVALREPAIEGNGGDTDFCGFVPHFYHREISVSEGRGIKM